MSIPRLLAHAAVFLALLPVCVVAQPALPVSWPTLVDADAQVYEDPYRNLTASQMEMLMALARVQQLLSSGEWSAAEVEEFQRRVEVIEEDLESDGLDAGWILAQREAVAARRQHAAVATNNQLDGKQVELSGYFIYASALDNGELVAYLTPDRGLCMHLPAPPPNQVIRLVLENMPDPVGPCIAAAVRGRLAVEETRHFISSTDGPAPMWSRWKMDVHEITTSGTLPD